MHIYVASSWRNTYFPDVVAALRNAGHDVYDFRNPPSGDPGFHWTNVDEHCADWEDFFDRMIKLGFADIDRLNSDESPIYKLKKAAYDYVDKM